MNLVSDPDLMSMHSLLTTEVEEAAPSFGKLAQLLLHLSPIDSVQWTNTIAEKIELFHLFIASPCFCCALWPWLAPPLSMTAFAFCRCHRVLSRTIIVEKQRRKIVEEAAAREIGHEKAGVIAMTGRHAKTRSGSVEQKPNALCIVYITYFVWKRRSTNDQEMIETSFLFPSSFIFHSFSFHFLQQRTAFKTNDKCSKRVGMDVHIIQ